jgi:hypothetical protein
MALAAALLVLAATPLAAPLPRGVSIVGSVTAEIIRAERVSSVVETGAAQRSVTPERDGIIVNFD